MKLIIDIPEEMYKQIKSTKKDGFSNYVHNAIRYGEPIPDNAYVSITISSQREAVRHESRS